MWHPTGRELFYRTTTIAHVGLAHDDRPRAGGSTPMTVINRTTGLRERIAAVR